MNKIISVFLLFFFISGSFVTAFSSVSAAELVENSWRTKAPMSQTRFGLGVVAVDGKIYAIGGFTNSGYLGTNERYDPVTDTWTTLTSMPTPRNNFAIATYDGKIYCIGGITSKSGGGWYRCGITEVYDVATDSWSTKASLPINGSDFQAYAVDGQFFVLIGRNLYMYNPNADSWIEKTSMPATIVSRASFVLTGVDEKIMVIGEFQGIDSVDMSAEQNIVIYDPKTDMWSGGTSPLARKFSGVVGVTTGVYAPPRVYILGTNVTSVYDPVDDVWSTAKAMPTARFSFGIAVVDDILYAIGGAVPNTSVEFLSVNEQYIPSDYNTTLSTTPPEPSKPTASPTLEPSDTSSGHFLIYIVVVLIALIVGVVGGVLFYFQKK